MTAPAPVVGTPVRYTIQRLPTETPTVAAFPTARDTATAKPATPTATSAAPSPTITMTSTLTANAAPLTSTAPAELAAAQVVAGGEVTATVPTTTGAAGTTINAAAPVSATTVVSPAVVAAASNESYTSTNQVAPPPSVAAAATPGPTATAAPVCPTDSTAGFDLIPIEGAATRDHPDDVHGDLNLALRGFIPISETMETVFYNGSTDNNAPRLHGLFEPEPAGSDCWRLPGK
jgi:hypothetical protein